MDLYYEINYSGPNTSAGGDATEIAFCTIIDGSVVSLLSTGIGFNNYGVIMAAFDTETSRHIIRERFGYAGGGEGSAEVFYSLDNGVLTLLTDIRNEHFGSIKYIVNEREVTQSTYTEAINAAARRFVRPTDRYYELGQWGDIRVFIW